MVAAEPRNRSNGHVLKKDVQAPPADAPAAAPGNGADAGEQWYSDEELARWIADGAGRDGGHSPRKRLDWRWLPYMVAVGPFLLVGLVFAALARLLLPSRVPVWGFRRRLAALRYLLAVGVLAGIVAAAVLVVVNGWPFTGSPAADSSVGQVVAPPAQQQTQAPAATTVVAAAAQAPPQWRRRRNRKRTRRPNSRHKRRPQRHSRSGAGCGHCGATGADRCGGDDGDDARRAADGRRLAGPGGPAGSQSGSSPGH